MSSSVKNNYCLIKRVNFQNIKRFESFNFGLRSGITLCQGASGSGKSCFLNLLSFILFPPYNNNYSNSQQNIPFVRPPSLEWILSQKYPKKDLILEIYLNISFDNESINIWKSYQKQIFDNCLSASEIGYKILISDNNSIDMYLRNKKNKWIKLGKSGIVLWCNQLKKNFGIDDEILPIYNLQTIFQLINLSPAHFFDYNLKWFGLDSAKNDYNHLLKEITETKNEIETFNQKIRNSDSKTNFLKENIKLTNHSRELNRKLKKIRIEKELAPINELELKIQALKDNLIDIEKEITQINEKTIQSEANQQIIQKKNKEEKISNEQIEKDYNDKKAQYLNKKVLFDNLTRNLMNWDKKVKINEREIKYSKMKIIDKRRRLKEIKNRLKKNQDSKELLKQKEKINTELKELEIDLNGAQERLTITIAEEKRLKIEKQTKSTNLDKLSEKVSILKQEKDKKSLNLKNLQKELDTSILNHNKLMNRRLHLSKEKIELEKKIESIQNELSKLLLNSQKMEKNNKLNIRAIKTLETLENQILEELQQIKHMNIQEKADILYEEHLKWLSSINNELKERKLNYDNLLHSLNQWRKIWQSSAKREMNKFEEMLKSTLKIFEFIPEFADSISLLPNEGYINLHLKDNKGTRLMTDLSSGEQYNVGLSLIVSLLFVQNKSFLILDDSDWISDSIKFNTFISYLIKQFQDESGIEYPMDPQIFLTSRDDTEFNKNQTLNLSFLNLIKF